jgi:hypothetical protein
MAMRLMDRSIVPMTFTRISLQAKSSARTICRPRLIRVMRFQQNRRSDLPLLKSLASSEAAQLSIQAEQGEVSHLGEETAT